MRLGPWLVTAALGAAWVLPSTAAAEPLSPDQVLSRDFELADTELAVPALDEAGARPHRWLGHTLRNLDLDLMQRDLDLGLSFDVKTRSARVKMGTFSGTDFGFGLDTDIRFEGGKATFNATLDIGLAGSRYQLKLPEVSMIPRSHKGERYIEYQMPIIRGNIDDVLTGLANPGELLSRLQWF